MLIVLVKIFICQVGGNDVGLYLIEIDSNIHNKKWLNKYPHLNNMDTKENTQRKNAKKTKSSKQELTKAEIDVINALISLGATSEDTAARPHNIKATAFPDVSARGNRIVNSPLYKLLGKKMVAKITEEGGKKPKWYLLHPSKQTHPSKKKNGLVNSTITLNLESNTPVTATSDSGLPPIASINLDGKVAKLPGVPDK